MKTLPPLNMDVDGCMWMSAALASPDSNTIVQAQAERLQYPLVSVLSFPATTHT